MTGFEGLVLRQFNGDRRAARNWVARLGRASYFRYTRPGHALNLLYDYKDKFPHLFVWRDGVPEGINWQSRRLNKANGRKNRGK